MIETKFTSLGDRMKYYEQNMCPNRFTDKVPLIIRYDGKNFSKYTRDMDKPFDKNLRNVLNETATIIVRSCGHIDYIYAQSDEISFLCYNIPQDNNMMETAETRLPFGGKRDKINSVLASEFTMVFNNIKGKHWPVKSGASFDCRSFQVPSLYEMCNYLEWRMQDWRRNFMQMLGRSKYSHKELMNVSCKGIEEKLNTDNPEYIKEHESFRRGFLFDCVKREVVDIEHNAAEFYSYVQRKYIGRP